MAGARRRPRPVTSSGAEPASPPDSRTPAIVPVDAPVEAPAAQVAEAQPPEPVRPHLRAVTEREEEPRKVSTETAATTTAPAPESQTEAFGRYLVKAREARGLSLDDVAHLTKIRRAILEALEGDARRDLPEKVFVLGYVRSYAVAVGLPVEEAARRFSASWADDEAAEAAEAAAKAGPSLAWIPPTIATLVAGGVLWYIVNLH